MAHHKSAQKRIRQTITRTERNNFWRSTMRTSRKSLHKAIESGDIESAKAQLPLTVAMINKVTSKGVLHKRTAQRYVSRDSKAVNRMSAATE